MGLQNQPVRLSLFLIMGLGISASAQQKLPPEGLPAPPPLPPNLAERPMTPPPELPDISQLQTQLKQLEELLSMPPEKLRKLRQTIEFIEKMSPAERDSMHIRLSQITQSTPELVEEITQMSQLMPKALESTLSQFWYASSEEERQITRSQLNSLQDSQKTAYLSDKVEAFAKHRDEVFAKMRESLESRRKAQTPNPPVPSP